MYKVTNQQLYSDIRQAMNGVELNEHSAEEMYSAIHDTLQDQEGFTEELIEKCASVAFDAVNDLYSQSQGVEVQSTYSGENLEDLFAADKQSVYAEWLDNLRDKYENWKADRALKKDEKLNERAKRDQDRWKTNEDNRNRRAARRAQMEEDRKARKKEREAYRNESREKFGLKKESGAKTFFNRFKDDKGAFMGLGKKGGGIVKWAKDNKAQAVTAGAVGAAAVGGAGYLAYRAYKKRKAAQANQQPNATHQVQPNVQ